MRQLPSPTGEGASACMGEDLQWSFFRPRIHRHLKTLSIFSVSGVVTGLWFLLEMALLEGVVFHGSGFSVG